MTPTERAAKVAEIKARLDEINSYIARLGKYGISVDDYTSDVSALLSVVAELEAELAAEKLQHSFDLHRIDAAVSRLEQIK